MLSANLNREIIAEFVKANPERLDMSTWTRPGWDPDLYDDEDDECGTTCCVAGWAVALQVGRLGKHWSSFKDSDAYLKAAFMSLVPDTVDKEMLYNSLGAPPKYGWVGMKVLGLTAVDAGRLFNATAVDGEIIGFILTYLAKGYTLDEAIDEAVDEFGETIPDPDGEEEELDLRDQFNDGTLLAWDIGRIEKEITKHS